MNSPVKSCSLDPIPTFLLSKFADLLTPFITAIVNASLTQGRLPSSQKHAIVTPHLKKVGLDASDTANYRPVSNLSFLSKVVERAVVRQLNEYLGQHDLLPRFQSAYRQHHSTETAMLRVTSDALTAADNRQVTLLALLDMSAAFDWVDHKLLLQRLEHRFGLTGDVLRWVTFFLKDRTQVIFHNGSFSSKKELDYRIPQGSVLNWSIAYPVKKSSRHSVGIPSAFRLGVGRSFPSMPSICRATADTTVSAYCRQTVGKLSAVGKPSGN